MRALVASAMLFLQLQPFLGVALCNAIGGAEGEGMEAGCPMPESGAGRGSSRTEAWSGPISSHECVFAEACAPSPTVVNPVHRGIVSLPAQFDASIRLSWLSLPTQGRSPPVPPPKA
jgi:hypothetical protein